MKHILTILSLLVINVILTASSCNSSVNDSEPNENQGAFPNCTCSMILDSQTDTWVEDIIAQPNIYGAELLSDVFDLKGIYMYQIETGDTIIHIKSQAGDDNEDWFEDAYGTCDLQSAGMQMYEYSGEKTLISTLYTAP